MNFIKKLFAKLIKQNEKEDKTWYNTITNNYDPKTGTPNGEAYISPNSVEIQVANQLSNK